MSVYKVLARASRSFTLLSASRKPQPFSTTLSHHLSSLAHQSPNEIIPIQVNLLNQHISSSLIPRVGFSSSASSEPASEDSVKTSEEPKVIDQNEQDKAADQTKESGDSDVECECDLFRDELIKLAVQMEGKHKEVEKLQDQVLRTYAKMENFMDRPSDNIRTIQRRLAWPLPAFLHGSCKDDRTRRDAENSKKLAIQNFTKSLLDVADNLGRASSFAKDSFSKIESTESDEAAKLLKTLLEGVEMTEKQLAEVLRKHGVEKFDPTNEPFDPHRHNAIFQIPDASKPLGTFGVVLKVLKKHGAEKFDPTNEPFDPHRHNAFFQIPDASKPLGTFGVVLKAGYMLYDRVIRPAGVGVTQEVEDNNAVE